MGEARLGLSNDTSVDSIWRVPQPHVEALALVKMLGRNGANVESLRELIEVPEETERHLRAFAAEFPDSKTRVERLLNFRKRVREEFEKLIQAPRLSVAESPDPSLGETPCSAPQTSPF